MQKILTKEELAARLNGCEYRSGMSNEIVQAAKENNLVIIHGASDDLIELRGVILDEVGASSILRLSRKGVPESDCNEGEDCKYYQRWLKAALKDGTVREIKVFWCGECGNETIDAAEYAAIGKPTWCFRTTMPHAVFSMYDTYENDREYFCRGIVVDLNEIWSPRSYESQVM